jgi:hypothetical protein
MESFSTSMETKILKNRLGENYYYFENIQNVQNNFGIRAFMPYQILVN